MKRFRDEERKLIHSHRISLSEIYDATGLSSAEAKVQAKALERVVLSNTPPCSNCGNRIRTRNWHCIECNRAAIAFQRVSAGHVYIAASASLELIKIGKSNDYDRRMQDLIREGYGGGADWRVLASCSSKDTGKIERFLHQRLSQYSANGSYLKGGREQQCYELYRCNFSKALQKLRIVSQKKDRLHIPESSIGRVFEFEK